MLLVIILGRLREWFSYSPLFYLSPSSRLSPSASPSARPSPTPTHPHIHSHSHSHSRTSTHPHPLPLANPPFSLLTTPHSPAHSVHSYMNAEKYNVDKIYFGGFFIRGHAATIATLSYAIRFWSRGTKRALFLRHEGFL